MGTRSSLALVPVSVLAVTLMAAAAPTPPPRAPELGITSISHDAQRQLKAGDRIRVTARGTGGGAARFHIVGVAADVGMRRTTGVGYGAGGPGSAGAYTGTYVVQPDDSVRDAAVLVTLAVGGREFTAAARTPVTIDGRRPRIISRAPAPDSRFQNIRPNILARLVDEGTAIDPASIRVTVNGRDVTSRTSVSLEWVSYIPETPLPTGRNRVRIMVADRVGNVLSEEWPFHVMAPNGLITSMTVNPATPLRRGEVFTVVLTGTTGGQASFTIGNPGAPAPMRESRPGQYVGSGAAAPGTMLVNAPVGATLVKGTVRQAIRATAGLTVVTRTPARPFIDTPRSGSVANGRLLLRGRGSVGSVIIARVTYAGPGAPAQGQAVLAELATVVGAAGAWSIVVDPVVAPDGSRLTVAVSTLDPLGQRSEPATLELGID